MTLTELRYIIAVAKEKHFGKAAKSCFVSQPTLSLGIKKLEEDLGVILFERGQKDLVITPIGKKVIEQAEKALKEVKAVKEIASSEKNPFQEPLRLGAIYTVGPYLFPSLFPVVQEFAPELHLFVEENFTSTLSDRLQNGDIDVAILSLPFEEKGLETMTLYDEAFVILLPSSHPLALKEKIEMQDLSDENVLLLGPQHCLRDQILALCPNCVALHADDVDLQNILVGSSIETIRYMVASGVGLTIFPCTAAGADRYKQGLLTIRRNDTLNKGRKVILAWRKGFPRMVAIQLLADCIRKCSLTGVKMVTDTTYARVE